MSSAEHTPSISSPVPAPAHPSQGAGRTNDISTTGPATRSGHIGLIVAGSLATGVVAALLLAAAPFIQVQENDITGAVLGSVRPSV